MAINKKLIHFDMTKQLFMSNANGLNNLTKPTNGIVGNIPYYSVVFLKDGYIWTHGHFINGTGIADSVSSNATISWSKITDKPSTFTPSAHTQAYTTLTGSGTTANQAIVSSGTANGWVLKTLGSRAFDSTSYLPLAGGTMNAGAMIVWQDWGQWEASSPTYPKVNGGLQWSGTSDNLKLFVEETASDDLRLILQCGDDASPQFNIRNYAGTTTVSLHSNGTITGTSIVNSGSNNNYVLLGGGGTKLISDFATSGHTHDDRYLKLTGGTMTGIETLSSTSAIKIEYVTSNGTRAPYYTASNYIHGGEDTASQDGANVQIGTWYGFGIYPTISGQTRTQGKNSFWHNARTGNTYTWGEFYSYDGSTNRKVLHEGNSSVFKSGETLTVKINGTSQSLTNTWRGIQNNLTSDSTTDSLSAAQGKALNNKFGSYLPLSGGTLTGTLSITTSTDYESPALKLNYYSDYSVTESSIAQLKFGPTAMDSYLGVAPSSNTHFGKNAYFFHVGDAYEFDWMTSGWGKLMALEASTGNLWLKGTLNGGTPITSSNIGSQSVNYATSAGNADAIDGAHLSDIKNWSDRTASAYWRAGWYKVASAQTAINTEAFLTLDVNAVQSNGHATLFIRKRADSKPYFICTYNNNLDLADFRLYYNGMSMVLYARVPSDWRGRVFRIISEGREGVYDHIWTLYSNMSSTDPNAISAEGENPYINPTYSGRVDWSNSSDKATKATQDSDGSQINTTYLKRSGGTMSGDIDMGGNNITNLGISGGIYWNPYVESASDGTDAASIRVVTGGVAGGTTLVISQQNDSNDTIQFATNGSANLYHNSYKIWDAGNDGSGSGLDADLLDGYHASSFSLNGHEHSYIISSGTITAISGTSRYSSGLRFGRVYSSGYPFSYGSTIIIEDGGFGAELIFNGLGGGGATGSGEMRFRTHSDWSTSEWGSWRTVLDSSNVSPSLPISGNTIAVTVGGVTSSYITVPYATNADTVDGYHESSFLRHRITTSTNQEGTLWSQIGIKQYNGALPDSLSGIYNWGQVITFATTDARFEIYASHQSSNPSNGTNGLYYRTGWDTDKREWTRFLDSNNSSVSKSGETLTVKINGTSQSLTNTNTTYSAGTGISLSGTIFSNSGVRAVSISGNSMRVNTNGTNADLTIPYANYARELYSNANLNSGNTATYPWRRIATTGLRTNNWDDVEATILIRHWHDGGTSAILKISLRTNDLSSGGASSAHARWLVRTQDYPTSNVKIALYSVQGKAYADVYLKAIQWQRMSIDVLANNGWTFKSSSEGDNSANPVEAYTSIEAAATALYGVAYTSITDSYDVGIVSRAISDSDGNALNTTYLKRSGGSMTNTNKVTNLNADLLDGVHLMSDGKKPWGTIPFIGGGDGGMEVGNFFDFHHDNTTGSDYSTRLWCTGNYSNTVYLPSATGTLALTSDNVASATKLQTARTLWGQSFNGTGNVSGMLTGWTGCATNTTDTWSDGTNAHPWYGIDHRYQNTGVYSTTISDFFGLTLRTANGNLSIANNGNIGVGTYSPSYKLDVNGTLHANDATTLSSTLYVGDNATIAGTLGVYGTTTLKSATTINANTYISGETFFSAVDAFRLNYGSYGVIHRNDGGSYWILLTNKNDQNGGFNSLRPFHIDFSNGTVHMDNNAIIDNLAFTQCNISMGGRVNATWGYDINSSDYYGLYFKSKNSDSTGILFSDDGNVGIGTTSPLRKLHVIGEAIFGEAGYVATQGTGSNYSGTWVGTGFMELSAPNPYIDFHGNMSTADYTSRLIQWGDKVRLKYENSNGVYSGYVLTCEGNHHNPVILGIFDLKRSGPGSKVWTLDNICGPCVFTLANNWGSDVNGNSNTYWTIPSNLLRVEINGVLGDNYATKTTVKAAACIGTVMTRWMNNQPIVSNRSHEDIAGCSVECLCTDKAPGTNLYYDSNSPGKYIYITGAKPYGYDEGTNGLSMDQFRSTGHLSYLRVRFVVYGWLE